MRDFHPFVILCALASTAHADYSYSVASGVRSMTNSGGETQSAVVAPGLKTQCPSGRIFITNELFRPPGPSTVLGRDLTSGATTDLQPTFDPPPDPPNTYWGTYDHDIVSLANGDLLLIFGVHFKAPVPPPHSQPAWFPYTYKDTFGPGARRGNMVWQSTDCGQTFHYRASIDPATLGDGSCALPSYKPAKVVGTAAQPNYNNGGSDGQLAQVNLAGNATYLTMPCRGWPRDPTKPGYVIDTSSLAKINADEVDSTYVLRSTNSGTWQNLGKINNQAWRYGVVELDNGDLAFARFNSVSFATKQANGTYKMPTTEYTLPTPAGWGTFTPPTALAANIWATTILARVPGSNHLIVTYPATIKDAAGNASHGHELYLFDRATQQYASAPPILPLTHSAESIVMHLAAISTGGGPVLLYWSDVNAATNTVRIRGRVIYDETEMSDDFDVALDTATKFHAFAITPNAGRWFGDYKTAGGYLAKPVTPIGPTSYHYYPMWDEADGTMRFSHVTVERTTKVIVGKPINRVLIPKWKPAPPPVTVTRPLTERERAMVRAQELDEEKH